MIATPVDSDRLSLRLPTSADAADLVQLLNDDAVVKFLSNLPSPYRDRDAIDFITSALGHGPLPVGCALLVEDRSTNAVVGAIGVRAHDLPDGKRIGEIGYWLGKSYWGIGYATEAVAAMLPQCFAGLGLDRMTASVDAENTASLRVLEKNGFQPVGLVDQWLPARGHGKKSVVMTLEADRWRAQATLPTVLVVAVALLDGDDRVLIAQRPQGKSMAGLWEFPGGKVAAGEAPEDALIRELREELGIDTEESCLAPFCFASHRYETFHLLMPLYICRVWSGQAHGREGQNLRWVGVNELAAVDMPPADIPLVAMLRDYL